MEARRISTGFVEDALESLDTAGIERAPVLALAGLPAVVAEAVDSQAYGRLWWCIAQALDDEFFGLGGRPMRPGSFALLCQLTLPAGTLKAALVRAVRFLSIVLDDPRGGLQIRDGEASIVLAESRGPRKAFAYRTYWLILMGVACWLVGRRLTLRRLDLPCAAPPDRDDYHQFFGAPVRFGQEQSRLVFDAAHLRLPVIRDERALAGFLRKAPGNILVRYRAEQGLAPTIRQQLVTTPAVAWPSLEELARQLEMSPVTLRRRLRAEGQSYMAIRNELRSLRATTLLAEGRLSIDDVAADLGYSEPSAFYRAFQKWTGTSPRASSRLGEAGRPDSRLDRH